MSDDFEDDFEDGLGNEAKAGERAGYSDILTQLLEGSADSKMRELSAEDRFLVLTNSMCLKLNNDRVFNISKNDRTAMLQIAFEKLPKRRYKNHLAFILGYIASEGGSSLKVKKVQDVISKLPMIDDRVGVEPADVVRYAKYWKEYL